MTSTETIVEAPATETSWVIASSHRSREKLHKLIGKSNGFYDNTFTVGHDYYPVTAEHLAAALTIKGIKLVKRPQPQRYSKRHSFLNSK